MWDWSAVILENGEFYLLMIDRISLFFWGEFKQKRENVKCFKTWQLLNLKRARYTYKRRDIYHIVSSGRPDAEAVPNADANSEADADAVPDAQYPQVNSD